DPKYLRNDPQAVATALARRGFAFDVPAYATLDARRKQLQEQSEALQAERNQSAKAIGKAKAAGADIEPLKAEVAGLGDRLAQAKQALQEVQTELDEIHYGLPNLPHASVPEGADED